MRARRSGTLRTLIAALSVVWASLAAAQNQPPASDREVDRILSVAREELPSLRIPATDSISRGSRIIAAGDHVRGSVATRDGNLEVRGTVDGDAIAINGDVVVVPGGRVLGDAVAIRGRVRAEGGQVAGSMFTLGGNLGSAPMVPVAGDRMAQTVRAVELVLSVLGILAFIGIGVLVFAGSHLDGVEESLRGRFSRTLLVGIGGQLALAPVLLLVLVVLVLTVLGILLIPFAIPAYALATAGVATLGFLAVARMTGASLFPPRSQRASSPRSTHLRALVLGLSVFGVLWLAAAMLTWSPVGGAIARVVVFVVTWVAVTAGFGAAIVSRAGTRRGGPATQELPVTPSPEPVWLTPTPVTGVAAARRPSATPRTGDAR
jgi:MFS family permease